MTQEDKDLLLKDLCARLPYGVCFLAYKVRYGGTDVTIFDKEKMMGIVEDTIISQSESFSIEKVRPYLRPMSSMTEEEYKEYSKLWDLQNEFPTDADIRFKTDVFDWLNAHHFDYRRLIEKGLAIEAPEGMYN